jgi:hypothetical protein
MRNAHTLLLFCLLFMAQFAQGQNYPSWTQSITTFPDSAYLFPIKILADAAGNSYTLSTYSKSNGSTNTFKIYITKFDLNGNRLWQAIDDNAGAGDARGYDMVLDDQSNVYVAGGLMGAFSNQIYLIKVSAGGSVVWTRSSTTSFSIGMFTQILLDRNKLYLASSSGEAIFDLNGNEKWSDTFPAERICVERAGQMIVSEGFVSGDNLVRFDSLGNQTFSDSTFNVGRIATDGWRNMYVLGQYPGYQLAKYDSNGVFQWSYNSFPVTPPFGDYTYEVLVDSYGDVVLTGLNDTMYKFSPNGNLQWIKPMNGLDENWNVSGIVASDLIAIAGIEWTGNNYDVILKTFDLMGNANWSGIYNSNSVQEIVVSMAFSADGFFLAEDSMSSTDVLHFDSPFFNLTNDLSLLCVDSVWYDTLNPNYVNVSVFNGNVSHLNYPSVMIVSSTGDTISNPDNEVNFFAHLGNIHLVYTDTITQLGITDFSEYSFIISEGFGTTSAVIGFCSTLGTEEMDWTQITIYPNPSSGQFEISNASGMPIDQLTVFDMSGRMVKSQKVGEASNVRLDFSAEPSGMYFVGLRSASGNRYFKVIIE